MHYLDCSNLATPWEYTQIYTIWVSLCDSAVGLVSFIYHILDKHILKLLITCCAITQGCAGLLFMAVSPMVRPGFYSKQIYSCFSCAPNLIFLSFVLFSLSLFFPSLSCSFAAILCLFYTLTLVNFVDLE